MRATAWRRVRSALVIALALAGCTGPAPPSAAERDYAALQRRLGESQNERAQTYASCVAATTRHSSGFINDMGEALDVKNGDVPRSLCRRLITGITRGTLSYRDFTALIGGTPDAEAISKLAKVVDDPGITPEYRGGQ